MTFINIYLTSALVIMSLMFILWIASLILKNASIIDIFWGIGFVLTCWVYFALTPDGFLARKGLICALVSLWGLRLSLYILWRNWGKGEDFRYQKWRQEEGANWWWLSFLRVFALQGILLWVISIPLLAAQINATPDYFTVLDGLGLLAWGLGFFFETVGDWQLARFKANPANQGQVMSGGVWHYTRHPNYFGDSAQWWGFYLIAAATLSSLWTIYSPILMTVLLLRVSGVTLLEKTLKETRQGYREYIQNTSAFIPWFPREK